MAALGEEKYRAGASDNQVSDSDNDPTPPLPRKRRKLLGRGKAFKVDFEDEDPSFHLKASPKRPRGKTTRATRQTSKAKVQANASTTTRKAKDTPATQKAGVAASTRQASKPSTSRHSFRSAAARRDAESAHTTKDLSPGTGGEDASPVTTRQAPPSTINPQGTSKVNVGSDSPSSEDEDESLPPGVILYGVPTIAKATMGIFWAAWKKRDGDATKLEQRCKEFEQQLEQKDAKLTEQTTALEENEEVIDGRFYRISALEIHVAKRDKEFANMSKKIAELERIVGNGESKRTDKDEKGIFSGEEVDGRVQGTKDDGPVADGQAPTA